MKNTLFFIIPLIAFTSCTKLTLLYLGVKNPKIENYKSLSKYLDKRDVDYNYFYVFKDSISLFSRMAGEDSLFGAKLDIPEAFFFDSKGSFFNYKDPSLSCNAGVDNFIMNLQKVPTFPINKKINIQSLLDDIVDCRSNKGVKFSDLPPSDYYIVMTWAKYIGKVNDDHTFHWLKIIEDNPNLKIHSIFLDCDFMDFWNLKNLDIKI